MKKQATFLALTALLIILLSSAVSAENTAGNSSSNNSFQSPTTVNNTTSYPDPIISGVVLDNSTNNGLANASIKVHLQNGTL